MLGRNSALAQELLHLKLQDATRRTPSPGPGYVTDHADLLTDEQEERIEQRLWEVEEQTGVEIVIVTYRLDERTTPVRRRVRSRLLRQDLFDARMASETCR